MLRIDTLSILLSASLLGAVARVANDTGTRPFEKLDVGARIPALLYAPRSTSPAPLTILLHGMCASPELECPVFERGTQSSWLLCPPGPVACGSAGAMWTGSEKTLTNELTRSIAAASALHGPSIDARQRILVGYSMGASAALRIVLKQPNTYQVLVIVNASVSPSAAHLRQAGVTRVALVSGARDRSAQKLRQVAARLAKAGLDAKYFALQKTGHYFDANSADALVEPLAWAQKLPYP